MPAEVIDLISSSPPPPPLQPGRVAFASSPPPLRSNLAHDRHHANDILEPKDVVSAETLAKRTGATLVQPTEKHDNDFLFLEDEFDVTGDLDGFDSTSNKGRSSNDARTRSSYSRSSTWAATTGARAAETTGPMRPTSFGRWNSIADPIENSSSPAAVDLTRDNAREISRLPEPTRVGKSSARLPSAVAASKPTRESTENAPISSDPFADDSPIRPKPAVDVNLDIPSDVSFVSPIKSKREKAAWDPISSSMPETNTKFGSSPEKATNHQPLKRKVEVLVIDDDDDSSEEELPDLDAIDFSKLKHTARSLSESPRKATKVQAHAPKKAAAMTADQKEWEKRRKEQAREAEKERKRIEKERAKEQRAQEKATQKALDEVNKVKTDKKASTSEMIVDLPQSFAPAINLQVNKILEDLEVQRSSWHSHPVDHIVKWRRKVQSRYNEDLGYWEPIPLRIAPENHVLVVIEAPEFVKLALGSEGHDLDAHVLKMRMHFANETIIYLLEGVELWKKKNRNARNRQFTNAVRGSGGGDAPPPSGQSRRRTAAAAHEIVDEDTIEDALVALQLHPGVLVHHTPIAVETAQWISVFTQHISTIPYRKVRDLTAASAGFCMETGQVRTGDSPNEIFVRMLQENARITAPMAYGIVNKYKSVSELVRGFEAEGPLALENCKKSANKDGALTDRTLGQAASRRLYKIFTGRDDGSTDI
ncbi:ERCC4 domain-containing protein [Apiospora rasikravindrae]|uniref:ERCC4 domain-containing protein n=1 Tax=Apiospora rasikravindrae TaxID=990691 RepID=A0ABR1SYA6_9PEZI